MVAPVQAHASAGRLDVVAVSAFGAYGGSEAWLCDLLDATHRLRLEVVLLQDGPFHAELERRGVRVHLQPVGSRPVDVPVPVLRLASWLRRRRPAVVLANGVKAQLVAGPASRLVGLPCVWVKHDHSFDATLARPLGRLADRVIGTVDEVLEPVRRSDSLVVPVPRPSWQPLNRSAAREELLQRGVPLSDDPTLVMLTRLVEYKGVEDALRALLLPAARGWRLVVLGEDDPSDPGEQQRLQQLAERLGVAGRVHLAGWVPRGSRLLAGFDALALLTRSAGRRTPSREGFGGAALEAMLAGLPVIAVNGGAAARRLQGRAGIGVPPHDPASVAAALGALRDPGHRSVMGAAARELSVGHPDASACATLLADALCDAAGRTGEPRGEAW